MKTKYLQDAHDELGNLKTGMETNNALWQNLDVKAKDLQDTMDELKTCDDNIQKAETQLQQAREEARTKVLQVQPLINKVTNLAIGLHATSEIKLGDYGIKSRKAATVKEIPAKAVIAKIEDDFDGEGFILTVVSLTDADYYEWQKTIGANGEDLVNPPYPFFKTSKKITFTDDEVPRGKRCFYRVRGVNTAGAGEWSEPVSKVQ